MPILSQELGVCTFDTPTFTCTLVASIPFLQEKKLKKKKLIKQKAKPVHRAQAAEMTALELRSVFLGSLGEAILSKRDCVVG